MHVSSVEVTAVSAHSPAARECLEHYFDELAARFPEGYDRQSDGAAQLDDFSPPVGVFLLAQVAARPVGCGALRAFSPGIGEIKRMWVSREFRGLGVGRRLLAALEHAARDRDLRSVRLDTHSSLAEALKLYRASGYREILRFNDNPYARHWFEKALD
ncbi:MAG: GNAT family N-acetyltransferase [Steroidobacteraceae bacterium]